MKIENLLFKRTIEKYSDKEIKDFEIMASNKLDLSFIELFEEVDKILIDTGALNGDNLAINLKISILLRNQCKLQNMDYKKFNKIASD